MRRFNAGEIDYVILRENTEGLYASRGGGACCAAKSRRHAAAVTRKGVERIVEMAFELARKRNGAPARRQARVTCCDKANVLRSYAFFRQVFDGSVAKGYPDIEVDYSMVDAMTVHLVERPDFYDVIVTENMFGDIISDLGAATVGGLGMSPSAEIGESHGFFQASHGSAPTIVGKDLANPHGTILSAALMLRWLGERHGDARRLRGRRAHRARRRERPGERRGAHARHRRLRGDDRSHRRGVQGRAGLRASRMTRRRDGQGRFSRRTTVIGTGSTSCMGSRCSRRFAKMRTQLIMADCMLWVMTASIVPSISLARVSGVRP